MARIERGAGAQPGSFHGTVRSHDANILSHAGQPGAARVPTCASPFRRCLQLNGEDARVLESSALLYDIGLVGVPRQIIRHWQEDAADA